MKLIDMCMDIYRENPNTCDYFYNIVLRKPFYSPGDITYSNSINDLYYTSITDILHKSELYKDYVVNKIDTENGGDTYIYASINITSIIDFIDMFKENICDYTIFKDIQHNNIYTLQDIISDKNKFKNTIYISKVELYDNKTTIKEIKFIYNKRRIKWSLIKIKY